MQWRVWAFINARFKLYFVYFCSDVTFLIPKYISQLESLKPPISTCLWGKNKRVFHFHHTTGFIKCQCRTDELKLSKMYCMVTGEGGPGLSIHGCGDRGGRCALLDVSFARCFAFWRTLSKTSASMFFQHRQNIASLNKNQDVLHDVLGFRNSIQGYYKVCLFSQKIAFTCTEICNSSLENSLFISHLKK